MLKRGKRVPSQLKRPLQSGRLSVLMGLCAALGLGSAACEDDDDPLERSTVAPSGSGGAGGSAPSGAGGVVVDASADLADSRATPDAATDAFEDAPVPVDAAAPPEDPLFLVHSAVQTTERRVNYFTVVSSLGETRKLDYSQAIELPGRARLYAEKGIGFFAIGDGETPTIRRYELRADGSLKEGAAISLQPQGVAAMGAQAVLFVSPKKAYYKDPGQAQIIVWNPTDMTVERSIPLPKELVAVDQLTSFSQWASRPGEAYFAVSWTSKQYDRVRPGTALVRIDTTTDAVTVTPDSRCRGLGKTGQLGGALYFFSDVINAFGHAVYPNEGGQQDCILRLSPGRTHFDPDYVGTVAQAFPGKQAGTVIAITSDGMAWVQVVDTSVAPTAPGTTYSEWYAKGWRWAHLKLSTLSEPATVPGESGAYAGIAFVAGSGFFISQTKADYSETTLVNLSGGVPTPGLLFTGFTLDVSRVR